MTSRLEKLAELRGSGRGPRSGNLLLALWLVLFAATALAEKTIPKDYDIVRAAAAGGDGTLYEGGDPFYERLGAAREKVNQALSLITAGLDTDTLCEPSACGKGAGKTLCHALESLGAEARRECRAFLVGRAAELARLDTDASSPFQVSPMPLTVPGPKGAPIAVSAMTTKEPKAPIVFHAARASALSASELVALIAHELGHKVAVAGAYVDDIRRVGSFPSGRLFLDAVGAAIASYAARHTLPPQAPPPVPAAIAASDACRYGADAAAKYLLGIAVDSEGKLPPPDVFQDWRRRYLAIAASGGETGRQALVGGILSGARARGEAVAQIFRKFLLRAPTAEELELMTGRLGTGVSYDELVASVLGDVEYMAARDAKTAEGFVTSAFLDLLGRPPTPDETKAYVAKFRLANQPTVALLIQRSGTHSWEHLVETWYREYLNRAPSVDEKRQLVEALKAGEGWEKARALILSSDEYAALQAVRWPSCVAAK